MPLDLFEQIIPAEVTGYIRAAQADYEANRFVLADYLPNTRVPDVEFRYFRGGLGLVNAAVYRGWDVESPVGFRQSGTRVTQELAPISEKVRLSEYDRLRLQNLNPDMRAQVFADAMHEMQAIAGQLELQRAAALNLGVLTVPFTDGSTQTVSFGRSGSHDVTAGTLWTDHTNATPLADLAGWVETYLTDTGVLPEVILMSRLRVQDLLANKQIQLSVSRGATIAPTILNRDDLNNVLESFDLPPIRTYDVRVNVAGTATRPIPANRVIMLNSDQLGATFYGITAEALELPGVDDAVQEGSLESGIVAFSDRTFDPIATWTKASAVALPGVANPDLTFAATVA